MRASTVLATTLFVFCCGSAQAWWDELAGLGLRADFSHRRVHFKAF